MVVKISLKKCPKKFPNVRTILGLLGQNVRSKFQSSWNPGLSNARQLFAADDIFRCIFFLGVLRVMITFGKIEISWKILSKDALSVLILCKSCPFFGLPLTFKSRKFRLPTLEIWKSHWIFWEVPLFSLIPSRCGGMSNLLWKITYIFQRSFFVPYNR